jgi:hypothetical protein
MLAALATVQRERQRIRIILCVLPTLSLNLKRARTCAEHMFRHTVVDNLDLEAAGDALAIPLASSGRGFGLSLNGQIVDQTAGYPTSCSSSAPLRVAGSASNTSSLPTSNESSRPCYPSSIWPSSRIVS